MKCVFLTALFTLCATTSLSSSFQDNAISKLEGLIRNKREQNISRDVQFFLYTRNNPDSDPDIGQQIWVNNDKSIKGSNFNSSLLTKFVVHGWTNNHTTDMSVTVKNAFLAQDDYNVIVVDWGNIARESYLSAIAQLNTVGSYIGELIVYLENGFLDLKKLTIVGHSLGAHVAGLAARYVNKTTNRKVLHVVGLDPAQPGFEVIIRSSRLRYEDAEQVEAIHTNRAFKGLLEPIGHLDFYPNGFSPSQPGCGVDLDGGCAHARAYVYYAEALTLPMEWIALKCRSFVEFLSNLCKGHTQAPFPLWTANFSKPEGTYILITNYTKPFGLGLAGIEPSTYLKVFTH